MLPTTVVKTHTGRAIVLQSTPAYLLCFLIGVLMAGGCDTASQLPSAADGLPQGDAAPQAFSEGAGAGLVARDIEEADVVKIDGDRLYALNRFKGLLVVDVADPDAPQLIGELDLRGRGVEMYVLGDRVHVLLSADFYIFAYGDNAIGLPTTSVVAPDGPVPPRPDFTGSRLAVVDVSDPTSPQVQGKINLVGFANESRRVGDIIYVVGSNYGPYFAGVAEESAEGVGAGFVASIDVSDPDDIVAVERKDLSGDALTMHVSQTAIFAASRGYDIDRSESLTDIQVIDISDPGGAIALRDRFLVPGSIRNRFYMDDYDGVFRIATESFGFGFQQVRLFTYDLTNLEDVGLLGQTHIIEGESLEAVRFDGPRGYVVTFLRVDPLFVLDLSDPANPAVTGALEVPGFSTHIEPRGERLIAVGIDDTDGRRPAVAYYDVSDPANPSQLGRVVLGPPGSFTSSEAVYDEKAFKIIDELGLIAIPFRHVDYGGPVIQMPFVGVAAQEVTPDLPSCVNAVQLVDFSDSALSQRGWFEHPGTVNRVGVIGDRVFALSQMGLQTVDISDRDNPSMAGMTEFFEADEMERFNDCGVFFGPNPMPGTPGFPVFIFADLEELLALLNACGVMGFLPALLTPAALFVYARRRRTRNRELRMARFRPKR